MGKDHDLSPDLILYRGRFYTVDAMDREAEAVAIKDGCFVAVGSSEKVQSLAGPKTREIDLQGLTVVPGFIDGHPHMDSVGVKLIRPSFEGAESIDNILEVIKGEVAKRPPGEWIFCNPVANEPEVFAFPDRLREGRWPTRHDLDQVSPANPVYIEAPMMVSPGIAVANSAALRLAGITRNTAAPEGVEIEKDDAGEPTGVFKDFNFPKLIERTLFPMLPKVTHTQMVQALRAAMKAFNAAGVTAIYEGHGIPPGPQRAYLDLWSERALTIRTYFVISYPIMIYHNAEAGDALILQTAMYAAGPGFGDDLLKFGGLGFSFDSASAIGASLMRKPYVGTQGQRWSGIQHISDETFKTILWKAAHANLRVQVQCSGGAAIDKVLAMYEEIHRDIPIAGKRWVIEHCQFPSKENMELCRSLGVIPTSSTNFLWLYGSIYVRCFGRELTQDAIPFKEWLDAGVPVVQSTDWNPYSPIFTFWQSLARRDGITREELSTPKQKLSRSAALRIYTANGAYVTFWEDRIGSIEPGKFADLVILSDNIMEIPEDRIPETKVLATLVGGRPVYDTGLF